MTNAEFRRSIELAKMADAQERRREIARLAAVVYRFNEYSQSRIEDAVWVALKIIKQSECIPPEEL